MIIKIYNHIHKHIFMQNEKYMSNMLIINYKSLV